MTTTKPAALIGKCVICKRTIRSESARTYCDCRANVECTDLGCAPYDADYKLINPHRHTHTAVKFRAIKGTVTDKACDSRCLVATSDKCACSCGGANHGADWAVAR